MNSLRFGKKWTQGNVTDFTYVVPTNKIDLENDIEFSLNDLSLSLKWNEPFTCYPLDLKIIQKPYLHKNHSHHEIIINESNDYQSGTFLLLASNLFVTSKNETTNSPIHQFTNLKCCKISFKAFKMKKKLSGLYKAL